MANLKFLSFFACLLLIVYVNANEHDGGHSSTYRKQDDHGQYSFGYHIKDKKGATNFRKEHGDGWNVKGAYGLHDKDGRLRVVHYVADKHGFRAVIKTNEPGTGNDDAANAIYNGPDEHGHSKTFVPSGSNGNDHWDHWNKKDDHWNKKDDHWNKKDDHWNKHDDHWNKNEKKEDHWNKHDDHWNKHDKKEDHWSKKHNEY